MRRTIDSAKSLCIVIAAMTLAGSSSATPITTARFPKGIRWEKGKTIDVFIQKRGPDGENGFHDNLKIGVDKWKPVLAERGITLNVKIGDPPPNSKCFVTFKYGAAGTTLGDSVAVGGEPEQASGLGRPKKITGAGKIIEGECLIWDGLDPTGANEQRRIQQLGAHELCHALGLADDIEGDITQSSGGENFVFNQQDLKEVNQLYGNAAGIQPRAEVQGSHLGKGRFDYRFAYAGLPGEHVTWLTLGIRPELVDDVVVPTGWAMLDPRGVARLHKSNPFYQDHMTSMADGLEPWDSSVELEFFTFRSLSKDYELSEANPFLDIRFLANTDVTGPIDAFAGGEEFQSVVGPVPEPCSLVALGALTGVARRRRR